MYLQVSDLLQQQLLLYLTQLLLVLFMLMLATQLFTTDGWVSVVGISYI